jgi:hypothetical protein
MNERLIAGGAGRGEDDGEEGVGGSANCQMQIAN